MKQYKIGDVARLLGLTPQALRFYEQEGVVVPRKSEGGTRYFTSAEIIRLLAFKKYRLSEFSVQDVAVHFKQGSLDTLAAQLDAQSDALIAQSEMLLRRARAIRRFERTLREAQRLEGVPVEADRPDVLLHTLSFDELNGMTEAQQSAFTAFANALPESAMYFVRPPDGGEPAFYFGIDRKDADNWAIPPQEMTRVPPARCVRVYTRVPGHPWAPEHLAPLLTRVRKQGFTIDPQGPVLGQHLASETIDRVIYLYAVLWIPLLPDSAPSGSGENQN